MCIVGLTPLDHSSPDRDDGMRAACGVNAVIPVGNTISRVSAHRAVGEHDLQLAEDHIPILTLGGIHEYKGINTCKGAILTGVDLWRDLFTDLTDQFRRVLYIVQAFDLLRNVAPAMKTGSE